MSQPLSDYFAQEAGEFLDQLHALLGRSEAPDAPGFFRLARGVRGSAQVAGAEGVARVAERLEDAARAYRDGTLAWSGEVRERARGTVADLRALVEAHGRWGAAEDARAAGALARWDGAAGTRRRADAAPDADRLFAFVRREIGGVADELDRALAEVRAAPEAREPLRGVLRRMRPVRGVAGMDALAPVLELLEGIEDAVGDVLTRSAGLLPAHASLLAAAGEALRAAAGVLERGEAPGAGPEMERFRELRDQAEGQAVPEEDVLPISALFFDDAGPHLVSSSVAPVVEEAGEGGAMPEAVEAFLRIEATGFLDRAEGLVTGAPAQPNRRFGRIARQLYELATSVRELAGTYGIRTIADAADGAARALRTSASPEEARAALRTLRAALPGAEPLAAEAPAVVEVPPAGAAEADEAGVVPVESLLYDADAALREALELRPRVEALAERAGAPLAEALDELFALVELSLRRLAT